MTQPERWLYDARNRGIYLLNTKEIYRLCKKCNYNNQLACRFCVVNNENDPISEIKLRNFSGKLISDTIRYKNYAYQTEEGNFEITFKQSNVVWITPENQLKFNIEQISGRVGNAEMKDEEEVNTVICKNDEVENIYDEFHSYAAKWHEETLKKQNTNPEEEYYDYVEDRIKEKKKEEKTQINTAKSYLTRTMSKALTEYHSSEIDIETSRFYMEMFMIALSMIWILALGTYSIFYLQMSITAEYLISEFAISSTILIGIYLILEYIVGGKEKQKEREKELITDLCASHYYDVLTILRCTKELIQFPEEEDKILDILKRVKELY